MNGPIGLIDWGIGGLSVYCKLIKKHKHISTIYFSDSGHTPYGKMSSKALTKRLNLVINFLRRKNVKQIIVACNAASTVLGPLQIMNPDLKLIGMLEAGIATINKSKKKSVLVLGGLRTIKSQYFQTRLKKNKSQFIVAQPLSAMIENGEHRTVKFDLTFKHMIKNLPWSPASLLLACTHYPAAMPIFKKNFPHSVILDPAIEVVKSLKKPSVSTQSKKIKRIFYTTGSPAKSCKASRYAFDIPNQVFKKVKFLI